MVRNGTSGEYEVSGPGSEPKRVPTYGTALSVAQQRAVRGDREATWYVRLGDVVVAHVTRTADGIVETRPVGKHVEVAPVAVVVALDEAAS